MIASDQGAALVLAVGLDKLTLGRVRAVLLGTEMTVEAVTPERAVALAQAEDGPVIGLLEWSEEQEEEQTRLCVALRRATRPGRCYIVAVGGLSDPALSRAVESTANDILNRPFGGEVLLLRLRHAVRFMRSTHIRVTPRDALDEALKSSSGGEVVVRAGEVVSHIHVQNGFIVWANLSSLPATMEDVVRGAGVDLGTETILAVREECRTSRAHFMDVLVAWKLIDPERAKEALRVFVAERVKLVLELPDASALFLPKARPHTEHLRFSADEIPSVRRPVLARSVTPFPAPPPSSRAPLPLGDISILLKEAARIEGAISIAVLDRKTGASLLLSGAEIDTSVAWAQVSLLAALGPQAEDVIGSTAEHCFVARPLQMAPSLALFVVLSQSATTIGLARSLVAQIAAKRPLAPHSR